MSRKRENILRPYESNILKEFGTMRKTNRNKIFLGEIKCFQFS